MSDYKPPFHMTDKMTFLIAEISEQVGRITVLQEGTISPHLRRKNRIRTIHSSLAIEHNSLAWYQQAKLHPLIKSAVFHYEFEFIHPFADGNGRMGRMWHSLLLGKWKELFFWLPIEELIQSRQKEYYDALGVADRQADSAGFVELMLEIIRDSLKEVTVVGRSADQDGDQVTDQDKTPVERLLSALGDNTLSTAELMKRLGLSHRPTFRKNYLNPALEQHLVERTIPDKPNSKNQRYRKRK